MGTGVHGGSQIYGLGLTLLIAAAVLAMRNRRPRRLRLEAMWIRPLIFLALVGLSFASAPPPRGALAISALAAALVLGVGVGWLRGGMMRIDVHPETHDISARASVVGMMLILGLLVLRTSLRDAATTTSIAGLPAGALTGCLILFAGTMMITQSLEMFLRARKLLAAAQAAKTPPAASPGANPTIVQ
jgi:membrane protein CcdC involved in cytochrome C biogenesis